MRAMQNIPTDTVEQSHCAFAQQVLVICNHGIPAALHVNQCSSPIVIPCHL